VLVLRATPARPPSLLPRCCLPQRFISRKTVDRVLKELREMSRPTSQASSASGGSFTVGGGGVGSFTSAGGGSTSRGGSFTAVAKSS
jgi:uncharacterized membrane protein YgcG